MSRETRLEEALRAAREYVQADLDGLLESCCLRGRDGKPDRATLDDLDRPPIEEAEETLRQIDAALLP
jgi:hypothetical protein